MSAPEQAPYSHLPELPRYIDSTMRSTFQCCPQKYFWQYCRRIASDTTSPDLHAGGAVAAAMEAMRIALYADGRSFDDSLIIATRAFMDFWGAYDPPDNEYTGKPHPKQFDRVLSAVVEYWRYYHPDSLRPYINADGSPAVEYSFAIPTEVRHPVTGDPFVYCGRFDMFGYFEGRPSALYVVDEKTTTGIGPKWASKWGMRGQFHGYAYAARAAGLPVVGAVIRGIGMLQRETKFAQAVITISNWQLDRWWEQLNHDLRRLSQSWSAMHFDMAFGDACEGYSGCQYMDLCLSRNPEPWIDEMPERLWNPLQSDPTETRKGEQTGSEPSSLPQLKG